MKKALVAVAISTALLGVAESAIAKPKRGDSILICMKNGDRCKAVMITPGEDESEIEYRQSCTYALFTMASSGERKWVPNTAISPKDGSLCRN